MDHSSDFFRSVNIHEKNKNIFLYIAIVMMLERCELKMEFC